MRGDQDAARAGAGKLAAWRAGTLDLRNQDAWRVDANVKRVALNSTVLSILEKAYGRPAFAFQTLNFAVGSQQPPHSDSTHFSTSPEGFMCGVWLALEDIDYDNGPLIYYPGSHRWPHYINDHIGVNAWHQPTRAAHAGQYQKVWDEVIALRQVKPERFTAKKGQAIIWHARLMHGGDKQNDPARSRFSQVTHYYFRDCSYYTPMYSDPFYGNIFFREMTDIATGEAIPNTVSGYKVPQWFIAQAKYHGPLGALRYMASHVKQRVMGKGVSFVARVERSRAPAVHQLGESEYPEVSGRAQEPAGPRSVDAPPRIFSFAPNPGYKIPSLTPRGARP